MWQLSKIELGKLTDLRRGRRRQKKDPANVKTGITDPFMCYNRASLVPTMGASLFDRYNTEVIQLGTPFAVNYGVDRVRFVHSAGEH